jgi:hypothetical protein
MDADESQNNPGKYVELPHLPDGATRNGQPVLNKYSTSQRTMSKRSLIMLGSLLSGRDMAGHIRMFEILARCAIYVWRMTT